MKIYLFIIIILFTISMQSQNEIEITCDSIYEGKKVLLRLNSLELKKNSCHGKKNSVFIIEQASKIIINDTIISTERQIDFRDFNGDNIKDVLIQNTSDSKSYYWTYYLYLYNPATNTFKKVEGFEKLKNPNYELKSKIIASVLFFPRPKNKYFKIVNYKIKKIKK